MMRKLLLAALLCSSVSVAEAQITFTSSNYAGLVAGDSVAWDIAQTAAVPVEGENQLWDYSYIKGLDFPAATKALTPHTGVFANASYMKEARYGISSFQVDGWVYFEANSEGRYEIGNEYIGKQFPLPGDMGTMTVPDQTNSYEPKLVDIKFPMSYNAEWSTTSRLPFNATLTIPLMGMNNTPAQLLQTHILDSKVVGWGSIKMPGGVTYEALLVKSTQTSVDSIFVNGAPAPEILLSQLGLVQSDTNRFTSYNFYVPGVKGALLSVYRADGNPQWTGEFRIGLTTTGVGEEPKEGINSRVYPNPVVGNAAIAFDKTSGAAWTITVYNTTGQTVQTYQVNQPAGAARVDITSSLLPTGSYRYDINNEFGARVGSGMMVVIK